MYAGQQQMKSAAWLQGHAGDRPSFQAKLVKTFSSKLYQVFAMPQGLLLLELRNKPGTGGGGNNGAIVAGAVLGGAIGACLAGALTANASETARVENFDMCSDEELFELASQRRSSFAVKSDEVQSVLIEAPAGLGRMFAPSSLAGYITIRARKPSKVALEIHDQAAMSVAVDSLPRRFAERCVINVEFDRHTTKFRPKG
jgi:hypothetical protein